MTRRRAFAIALRVIFALSLLANAVVLGLWFRVQDLRDTLNGGSGGLRSLPAATRAEIRDALADHQTELRAALDRLGKARAAMFAAAQTPRDPARLEAAMAEVRAATTALQVEGQRILTEGLARSDGKG